MEETPPVLKISQLDQQTLHVCAHPHYLATITTDSQLCLIRENEIINLKKVGESIDICISQSGDFVGVLMGRKVKVFDIYDLSSSNYKFKNIARKVSLSPDYDTQHVQMIYATENQIFLYIKG